MVPSKSRRLRMKEWLCRLLDEGCPGIRWENQEDGIVRIDWKHGSRHGYNTTTDAEVFRKWAEYTGKLPDSGKPDPKKWKANFRCALNSLKDVVKLTGICSKASEQPYRLFKLIFHPVQDLTTQNTADLEANLLQSECIKSTSNERIALNEPLIPLPVQLKNEAVDTEMENEKRLTYSKMCPMYPMDTPPTSPEKDWSPIPVPVTEQHCCPEIGTTSIELDSDLPFDYYAELLGELKYDLRF